MSRAVPERDIQPFFDLVSAAASRVLLIDYDGTVAPFRADRSRAIPYPGLPRLLDRINKHCGTKLIVLTGGSVARIPPLLGLDPPPEIWGAYGLERLYPDGRYEGAEITDKDLDALAEAESFLNEEHLGKHIEIGPGKVAVHWRGLEPEKIIEIRAKAYRILSPLAAGNGLVIADFDGGLELRVPSASAGDAIRSILMDTDENIPVAYLGDDTPDEEAFRVLNNRGLTALVRPKYRFTAAELWLRPPGELISFLKSWISACGGAK